MTSGLGARIAEAHASLVRRPLWRRPFVRNVAVVAGGATVAQVIGMLFSPVITRLYLPEAFGILGVLVSVVAVLSPIASLCYELAIVLPASDSDALRLLRLSIVSSLGVALVSAVVIAPFRKPIAGMLGLDAVAPYLLLAPLVVVLDILARAYDQWLIRTKRFRDSSAITIAQTLVMNAAKTFFGLVAPGVHTLVGVSVGGTGLHALLSMLASRKARRRASTSDGSPRRVLDARTRTLAKEYRDFPVFRTPQAALSSLSRGLPVLMLAGLFGPASAGLYAIGQRVLQVPSAVVSVAVSKVFRQRVAEAAHKKQSLQPLLIKTTLVLAAVGAIPFGLVMLLGPRMFALVFGAEWYGAGVYARWTALWLFTSFINGPSVAAIPLLSLQGHLLGLEIVTVLARVIAIMVGALVLHDDTIAVLLFSLVGAASYGILVGYTIWCSGRREARGSAPVEAPTESSLTLE